MRPTTFRIVIDGELDDVSAAALDDLLVERSGGVSVLRTGVLDQAGLNGVLDRLRLIGLSLVGLERLPAEESPRRG